MNRRAFLGALGDAASLGVVAAAAATVPALASADEPVVTVSGSVVPSSPEELARAIRDAMRAIKRAPLAPILYAPPGVSDEQIRAAHEALMAYADDPSRGFILRDGWTVQWAHCGAPCVAYGEIDGATP